MVAIICLFLPWNARVIAIPQYQSYVVRAQVGEGLRLAYDVKTAIAEYYNTNGMYPPKSMSIEERHEALGIAASTEFRGKYVRGIEVMSWGSLKVQFLEEVDGVNALIANKTFYLIPTDNDGSISWQCAVLIEIADLAAAVKALPVTG